MTTVLWKGVVELTNGQTVTLTGTCDVGEATGDYYGPRWLGIETDANDLNRCMWALMASGWGYGDTNRISAAIHRACREATDDWLVDHDIIPKGANPYR